MGVATSIWRRYLLLLTFGPGSASIEEPSPGILFRNPGSADDQSEKLRNLDKLINRGKITKPTFAELSITHFS